MWRCVRLLVLCIIPLCAWSHSASQTVCGGFEQCCLSDDYACNATKHQYGAKTLTILQKNQLCDGRKDCPLGDDEQCLKCESSPPVIEGGFAHQKTLHAPVGTHISYTCHNGYHMVGSDVSVCLGNGSWSIPPICTRVCKKTLPLVNFGSPRQPITNTAPYFAGEHVEYECESGYEMELKNFISCQPDGTWSNNPKCIHVSTCTSLLPTFDNMVLVNLDTTEFVSGAVVLYRCQEGFIFPGCGRNYLLCGDDGQWIGNPECIPDSPLRCGSDECTLPVVVGETSYRLCRGGLDLMCDPKQGNLQMFLQNQWIDVEDDYGLWLGSPNLGVACRSLGFSRAIGHSSFPEKRTVTVDTTYVIVDMTCDGEETNLFDCEFDIIQTNYQSRIGIMCANACEEDYQVRIPNPFKYDWSA